MMFIFNGIIFVGGIIVLSIGIWVKLDGGTFLEILASEAPLLLHLVNVGYLCIAVGGFLMLMGFLGCCGAVMESRCMLMISKVFIEYLGIVTVKYLRSDYGENNELTKVWDSTMKEMKCCGFNGYTDFINSTFYMNNKEFPPICCAQKIPCWQTSISSEIKGCLSAFENFLGQNGKIVGGVALVICGLELAAMGVALVLYFQIGIK